MKLQNKKTKFIVITGGVLSGLGKGVTLASIGFFFSEKYKVVPIKLDGYLNSDPGTMNPIEHGEVFVLDDGFEVDMDFGHYERFLNINCNKNQSLTMGKIFKIIRLRERKGEFLGKTVQFVPHVTDLIQEKIIETANKEKADVVLLEVGGTVGDLENELYIEALRQLKTKVGKENIIYIHLTYVPIPYGVNEQKTKPTQQSINLLHKKGIWPSIIIGRCGEYLEEKSKEKIGLFSNISKENVFSAPDLKSIYELPNILEKQNLMKIISKELNIKITKAKKIKTWENLLINDRKKIINVTIAGKYTNLEDSYASIIESLEHCSYNLSRKINITYLDTSKKINEEILKKTDAIIVPGGFGERGVEGKIKVIQYARENKIPFLGICYGLQLAVIEIARNILKIKDATTMEINKKTKSPVITLLNEQKEIVNLGGTMRLGKYLAKLQKGIIYELYKELNRIEKGSSNNIVSERHRHRFEVNPNYIKKLEKNGLIISGKSLERDLVEFIELDKKIHPYFVATQSHPELKSKLETPAPLFYGLIKAAIKKNL
jgi:CTP synthase